VDPDLAAYLDWLRGNGVSFDVAEPLPKDDDHDGPLRGGVVEPGARFWDVGCGTGVLTVIGGRLGATEIHATDVEPQAVVLARHTCAAAGVKAHFEVGPLLEPIPHDAIADVVIANLPHKPVPPGVDLTICQRGGPDGAQVHGEFCEAVRARLAPGGRILFFLHSLPHPRLLACYGAHFRLTLRSWKRRWFQPGEYGPLQEHFVRRARDGLAFVVERDGRRFLIAGVWEARAR